jgi:hypothetical protein
LELICMAKLLTELEALRRMIKATAIGKAISMLIVLTVSLSSSTPAQQKRNGPLAGGTPVLWRSPGDISALDLRYGPGSAELAPAPPFTFVEEVKIGASPKFKVTDSRGITWAVKLGPEAQAETVAARLVWAMGYFAEEAYYLDRAEIKQLPRLSRGSVFVEAGSIVRGARFEPRRNDVGRGATWDWLQNPFAGTRELDGLKVLMVLLANYDTRLANNRVLSERNPRSGQWEDRYVATDIGATFGRVGGLGGKRTKNNLEDFRSSRFVLGVQDGMVEFDYNTTPQGSGKFASFFNPGYRKSQANKEKAMRRIPVENARWIGSQLSRLSDEQLRDAFRAAGYETTTMEGFIKALRERIEQLNQLGSSTLTASITHK